MKRLTFLIIKVFIILALSCQSKKQKTPKIDDLTVQISRPRVLIDEANFNVKMPELKPFIDILTNEGFVITRESERFNRKSLNNYDILVIIAPLRTNIRNSVVFSPNGKILASGGGSYTVNLWDVETGHQHNILKNTDWAGPVAYAPNGISFASANADLSISLWDLQSGQEQTLIKGLEGTVRSMVFTADSQTLIFGGDSRTINFWDLKKKSTRLTLKGHRGIIHSMALSPDNKVLASGSSDGTIKLWNPKTGQLRSILNANNGAIRSVTFSPNGQFLASGGNNEIIKLWDVKTEKVLSEFKGQNGPIYLAFSPEGKILASGGSDEIIELWDVESGQRKGTLMGHKDEIWSVAFSPDGNLLASIDYDERIKLWDVNSGKVRQNIIGRHNFIWNPGPAFTKEECDAVQDWVYNGGRLLLVTDHAPYSAGAEYLAKQFGVSLSKSNGTLDPNHHDVSPAPRIFTEKGNSGWLTFSFDNGLLKDHPITQGRNDEERINRVITYFGNSLEASKNGISFLTLSSSAIDVFQDGEEISVAGHAQGVAEVFGKGRVVVLGEMGMLMVLNRRGYDNKQLALNIMHWLSGSLN